MATLPPKSEQVCTNDAHVPSFKGFALQQVSLLHWPLMHNMLDGCSTATIPNSPHLFVKFADAQLLSSPAQHWSLVHLPPSHHTSEGLATGFRLRPGHLLLNVAQLSRGLQHVSLVHCPLLHAVFAGSATAVMLKRAAHCFAANLRTAQLVSLPSQQRGASHVLGPPSHLTLAASNTAVSPRPLHCSRYDAHVAFSPTGPSGPSGRQHCALVHHPVIPQFSHWTDAALATRDILAPHIPLKARQSDGTQHWLGVHVFFAPPFPLWGHVTVEAFGTS